jgi:L-seryl-tRNA(Ser) seleniumtransferase
VGGLVRLSDGATVSVSAIFERFGVRRVINASGTETVHGASRASTRVAEAVAAILPHWIEMAELQRAASETIARVTGAEAGFVTGCTAAGISVAVAAAMTGSDLARVERLPDVTGLRHRVILQKGHEVNFGGTVTQMIRLTGATPVEIGTATSCAAYQLEGAIDERTAAAVYVLSHHTVQSGLLGLAAFSAICGARGVPVIVDAAAEYDWPGMLAAGATAVIFSAQKAPAGTTAGVIAGSRDFARACFHQERGIGRPMKAGKENVAGAIAALEQWRDADHAATRRAEAARLDRAEASLRNLRGLRLEREADPSGNPFERLMLHVDPRVARISPFQLGQALAAGDPKIVLRTLHADRGYLLLDVRRIDDGELELVVGRIREALAAVPADATPAAAPAGGDLTRRAMARWLAPDGR